MEGVEGLILTLNQRGREEGTSIPTNIWWRG